MIIKQEHKASFEALFDDIYLGNEMAKDLSFMILECLHIWDDSVDQDKDIAKQDANRAWVNAMIQLPTHPIYKAMPEMPYLIRDVYFKWVAANEFEKSGNELEKAFVLRAELYGLFVHIAGHVGGFEHAEKVSPIVWSLYGEKLCEFIEEVKSCQIQ